MTMTAICVIEATPAKFLAGERVFSLHAPGPPRHNRNGIGGGAGVACLISARETAFGRFLCFGGSLCQSQLLPTFTVAKNCFVIISSKAPVISS